MKGNLINFIRNGFIIWCTFGLIPIWCFLYIINRLDLFLTALNSIRDMTSVLIASIIVFCMFCSVFFLPSLICLISSSNNAKKIIDVLPYLVIILLGFFLLFFIFLKYQFNLYFVVFFTFVMPIILSFGYSVFDTDNKMYFDREKQKICKPVILAASGFIIYILLLHFVLSDQLLWVGLILIALVILVIFSFNRDIRLQNKEDIKLLSKKILHTFFFILMIALACIFPEMIYLIDVGGSEEELTFWNAMLITGFMFLLSIISLIPAVLDYQSSITIPKFPARRIYTKKRTQQKLVSNTACILLMGFFVMFVFLGKGRQINFKALAALGMVQADVRQYKINREHYLPTMFDQTIWGEGFKIDEKYIYINAIRLFRLNGTNLICPPLIEKYLDEVKGTDNGISGGMHSSPNQIRQYTHLCLVINDSEIALWPYLRDIKTPHTINTQ